MTKTASVSITVTVNDETKTFAGTTETDGDICRAANGLVGSMRWDASDWLDKKPGKPEPIGGWLDLTSQ